MGSVSKKNAELTQGRIFQQKKATFLLQTRASVHERGG